MAKKKDLYAPLTLDFVFVMPGTGQHVIGHVKLPMTEHTINGNYVLDRKTMREDMMLRAHEGIQVRPCKGEVERAIRAIKARRKDRDK